MARATGLPQMKAKVGATCLGVCHDSKKSGMVRLDGSYTMHIQNTEMSAAIREKVPRHDLHRNMENAYPSVWTKPHRSQ